MIRSTFFGKTNLPAGSPIYTKSGYMAGSIISIVPVFLSSEFRIEIHLSKDIPLSDLILNVKS